MNTPKTKWPRAEALQVARELIAELAPVCERIVIAGSLRRGKAEVGDIELLFIPRFEDRQFDMFTVAPMNLAEEKIGEMLASGTFFKRPGKTGVFSWAEKNKLGVHAASGIAVDLFSTTPENWFVSLVVRTGSKETNLRLTCGARDRNRTLNAYGCGTTSLLDGSVEAARSEEDVFALCGVKYLAPEQR